MQRMGIAPRAALALGESDANSAFVKGCQASPQSSDHRRIIFPVTDSNTIAKPALTIAPGTNGTAPSIRALSKVNEATAKRCMDWHFGI